MPYVLFKNFDHVTGKFKVGANIPIYAVKSTLFCSKEFVVFVIMNFVNDLMIHKEQKLET